jgi:hypothetical protein
MKADPSVRRDSGGYSKLVEFAFKNALQATWAGCKESVFCAIHSENVPSNVDDP